MNALPSIFESERSWGSMVFGRGRLWIRLCWFWMTAPLGGGTIDTSPGSINVVSVSGRIAAGTTPIQPLFLVGDLKWTAARRTELGEIIKTTFIKIA